MGARNIGSVFDFSDVFASVWGDQDTGGKTETVTVSLREVGEPDGADATKAPVWGMGCVAYRPAPPSADGKCQALTIDIGGQAHVIATQDARINKAIGALNEGDAAFAAPTGNAALRANADGSIAMLHQGASADSGIGINKDGTISIFTPDCNLTLGPDGLTFTTKGGEQMVLGEKVFQVVALQGFIRCGVVGLGPSPAVPLTFSGTSGVVKPAPNILI